MFSNYVSPGCIVYFENSRNYCLVMVFSSSLSCFVCFAFFSTQNRTSVRTLQLYIFVGLIWMEQNGRRIQRLNKNTQWTKIRSLSHEHPTKKNVKLIGHSSAFDGTKNRYDSLNGVFIRLKCYKTTTLNKWNNRTRNSTTFHARIQELSLW